MRPVDVHSGQSAMVLGQPHGGTFVPDAIRNRLNEKGRDLADTDWHIGALYDGLINSATTVRANFHRYIIDANRDPADSSLYPGQNTTSLCPTTDFNGHAIWVPGQEPSAPEIAERREIYHKAYHQALAREIDRVRNLHGVCILFDCHSIRSEIAFLFEGSLPVFSVGTNDGHSCSAKIQAIVESRCRQAEEFSFVTNGRFKGGWTTRHYGRPAEGVHAIQMELAQRAYLATEQAPWEYDELSADRVRGHLRQILSELDQLARSGALSS